MKNYTYSRFRSYQFANTSARLLIVATFVLLSSHYALSQTVHLVDVVPVEAPNQSKPVIKADKTGGTMQFERTYRKGCVGNYHIQWKFSKDISQLKDGEEFSVTINCLSCNSPCGYKWTSAAAGGANNITKPVGKYTFEYNGNITTTKTTGRVHAWYPGHQTHTTDFTFRMKKDVPNTAFYIAMGNHRVYYVYGKSAATSTAINCHTLLGLGKLVGMLEVGAMEGYGKPWMIKTIDYALDHIEASKCLSPVYLEGLKKRIMADADIKSLYKEIQDYSAKLETETAVSCAACGSCK